MGTKRVSRRTVDGKLVEHHPSGEQFLLRTGEEKKDELSRLKELFPKENVKGRDELVEERRRAQDEGGVPESKRPI